MDIKAKFEGLDANEHRLPAIEAGEALTGIGRSLVILSNYLVEGRVRRKAPYLELSKVYLRPVRPGSLEALFDILFDIETLKTAGMWTGLSITSGVLGNAAYDLIKTTFRRSIGKEANLDDPNLKQVIENRDGDLDALVDAIEPALRQAHRPISIGAINININHGHHQIVEFNPATKRYVETDIRSPTRELVKVSTASYNANTKYGRVFDYELGRTVAFKIAKEADPETLKVITDSLSQYATEKTGHFTAIVQKTTALDGRERHYLIWRARRMG